MKKLSNNHYRENICLFLAYDSVPSVSFAELLLLLSTVSKNTQILTLNISLQLGENVLSKVNFQGIRLVQENASKSH